MALCAAAPAAPAPARVAILLEDQAAGHIGDLLTVELSRRQDVQLLERAEIDRVYHEQQLSSLGTDYLKLGQVLGADGLIILEVLRQGTNQYLDFRFIAVKQGVVLANERFEWSLASSQEWPTAISRLLSPLISKISVLPAEAVPLSVVGLRSAIQSQSGREIERQLTLLLLQRLSRQPEIYLLERRRLQALTSEKGLDGMDDSAFWNGSFLGEGTIDRDGYSERTLTINARLVPPRGGPSQNLDLSCARTNLTGAVDQLARLVLAALKLQPADVPWSPAEEAEQYRSDADWAFRWGLLEQSEAASEAAWALGLHSEPLARLRVRAYAADAWPLELWSGNIEIPGLPNSQKLGLLNRALELFCQDWNSESHDAGRLNDQWYLMGSRLFRASAALLDGFYRWVDLRDEDQLEETRRLTRQLLAVLETKIPADPVTMRQRRARGAAWGEMLHEFEQAEAVKWNEGGLLYERPQDSLPLFASMLARGFVPDSPPRIIGWKWEDRNNAPRLQRQFIDEACASTNPPTRLGGLMIALARIPLFPESAFQEKENALATAMWECRDWILADASHAELLSIVGKLLRHKYAETDGTAAFSHEPLGGVQSASADPGLQLHVDRPLVRKGRLWSLGVFLSQQQFSPAPLFCVATDPATGKCQHHLNATLELARLYSRGVGQPRGEADRPVALLERILKANREGNYTGTAQEAFEELILRFEYGIGIDRDVVAAVEWHCRAALADVSRFPLGNTPLLQSPLGAFFGDDDRPMMHVGIPDGMGRSEAFVNMLAQYLKAARGDAAAAARIGDLYLSGQDLPRNPAKAWRWFTLAARADGPKYQDSVAHCEAAMTKDELDAAKLHLSEFLELIGEVANRIEPSAR